MGSITDFLELELLDHVFNASYTAPTNIYLCLCTADPTDAATGASCNETANASGYARTEITFGVAASRVVTQDAEVSFPQATGDYASPITHWAIVDTNTYGSGNILAHGALSESKTIYQNNTPKVAASEINVTFSAGEISDYLANELLDHVFNNAAYTAPDTYVALFTTTCSDSATGTEVSGGSYARVQVNVNGGSSPTWDLAASGLVDNTHAITFATATASWGTVVAFAIMDASTSGNMLFYDNDMADQAVSTDDVVEFSIGDLDVTLS
jgi:hypothetical protein